MIIPPQHTHPIPGARIWGDVEVFNWSDWEENPPSRKNKQFYKRKERRDERHAVKHTLADCEGDV